MSISRSNTTSIRKSLQVAFVVPLVLVPLFLLSSSACLAQPLTNAKDMFYEELKNSDNSTGTSIAYCLELRRKTAKPILVNNRYPFQTGDGLRLHVKSSSPVYAYIYLVEGSDGSKARLYPPPGSTENNRIEAGKECVVPPKGMIVFDAVPGTEKLAVVFSPKPTDADPSSMPAAQINADTLTGIPQKLAQYSVYSNDGVYAPEQSAPGNGLVFVHNPNPNLPTAISIVLNHLPAPKPEPAPTPTPVTPVTPPAPKPPISDGINRPLTDKWAFIVGIDKFANYPEGKLNYCVSDAKSFRDFLVKEAGFKPNHVYFLYDEQATSKNINRVLTTLLPAAVRPDDLVVTYFSTHGTGDMHGENYIVTYDFDGTGKTGIAMQELGDTIKSKISSERIVMVLDTCFSGNAKDLDQVSRLDELVQGCGHIVVSACGPNERSLEDSKLGHGYFSYYLMDSLRKTRALKTGFDLAKNVVTEKAKAEHQHSQHPIINYSRWRGNDLVLFAKPTDPRN